MQRVDARDVLGKDHYLGADSVPHRRHREQGFTLQPHNCSNISPQMLEFYKQMGGCWNEHMLRAVLGDPDSISDELASASASRRAHPKSFITVVLCKQQQKQKQPKSKKSKKRKRSSSSNKQDGAGADDDANDTSDDTEQNPEKRLRLEIPCVYSDEWVNAYTGKQNGGGRSDSGSSSASRNCKALLDMASMLSKDPSKLCSNNSSISKSLVPAVSKSPYNTACQSICLYLLLKGPEARLRHLQELVEVWEVPPRTPGHPLVDGGYTLRARRDIPAFQVLGEYAGEIIEHQHSRKINEEQGHYVFEFTGWKYKPNESLYTYTVSGNQKGNELRFANDHNGYNYGQVYNGATGATGASAVTGKAEEDAPVRDPNCVVVEAWRFSPEHAMALPCILFITQEPVSKGQEILIQYGDSFWYHAAIDTRTALQCAQLKHANLLLSMAR